MKITIAGANSFIGKRLVAIAEQERDTLGALEIVAVIRKGSPYRGILDTYRNVEIVECNMEDYSHLGDLTGKGDCFIDLAWNGSRGTTRQDHELQKFDYESSMAAMKSMAETGYKTLVSSGSQAEYGIFSDVITEETPCNPNTEYGKYKLQIFHETTELARSYGCRFIEPRYFSLYGPGDYEKTLIMTCIKKMLHDENVELNDCTQIWDYMYVDDAIRALIGLCQNEKASGVFNFATGKHKMIREFVMDIHEALNSRSKVEFGEANYNGLIINLMPNIKKLEIYTKWAPTTTFTDGIKLTAESFG